AALDRGDQAVRGAEVDSDHTALAGRLGHALTGLANLQEGLRHGPLPPRAPPAPRGTGRNSAAPSARAPRPPDRRVRSPARPLPSRRRAAPASSRPSGRAGRAPRPRAPPPAPRARPSPPSETRDPAPCRLLSRPPHRSPRASADTRPAGPASAA